MNGLKEMEEGVWKYKNVKILHQPSEKYPDMVWIERGPAKMKSIIDRRYITLEKAIIAVDVQGAENLIRGGKREALAELADLGLTHDMSPEEVAENPQIDILA
jgi:hypothetical protein